MDTNNVLRKLNALLARGNEANNDNENERAIAMRQAQKLMDQYNITLAEVEAGASHNNANRGESELTTGQSTWKQTAYNTIGALYGVKVYKTGRGRNSRVILIGSEHNRTACLLMGRYIVDSIEREAKKYYGSGKTFIHSFKMGAVAGVYQQVKAILAERARGETQSVTGNALVLVDYYKKEMELNQEFLANKGIRLSKATKFNVSDPSGYYTGQYYGSNLSLNNQVVGNRVKSLTR